MALACQGWAPASSERNASDAALPHKMQFSLFYLIVEEELDGDLGAIRLFRVRCRST